MKKLILTLALMISMTISASAMSSQQARSIALFLTDKMAYELNLTEAQYNAAYEINYDYLLKLDDGNDLYGTYWNRRNTDMRYILGSSKYSRYLNANYFYRPAYWNRNRFNYRIYSRYPDHNKSYYNQPNNADNYSGNHSWKANNNRSYYKGKQFNNGTGMRTEMNSQKQNRNRENGMSERNNSNQNSNQNNESNFGNRNNSNNNRNNPNNSNKRTDMNNNMDNQ